MYKISLKNTIKHIDLEKETWINDNLKDYS